MAHVEQLPGGPTLGAATVEDLPSDAAMRRRVAGSLEGDPHLRASRATSPDQCVGKRLRHGAIEPLAVAPVKQPTSTGTARKRERLRELKSVIDFAERAAAGKRARA